MTDNGKRMTTRSASRLAQGEVEDSKPAAKAAAPEVFKTPRKKATEPFEGPPPSSRRKQKTPAPKAATSKTALASGKKAPASAKKKAGSKKV